MQNLGKLTRWQAWAGRYSSGGAGVLVRNSPHDFGTGLGSFGSLNAALFRVKNSLFEVFSADKKSDSDGLSACLDYQESEPLANTTRLAE